MILRENEIRSVTTLILFGQILIPVDKLLLGIEASPRLFEMATLKSEGINEVARSYFRSCPLCTAACGGTDHSDRHEQNQEGKVIPERHDSPELHLHHNADPQ